MVAAPRPTGWNLAPPALPALDMLCWWIAESARSAFSFVHSTIRHFVRFRRSSAVAQPKVSVDHVSRCRWRCCAEARDHSLCVSGKFGASHRVHHGMHLERVTQPHRSLSGVIFCLIQEDRSVCRQRLCLSCPCLTPMTKNPQETRQPTANSFVSMIYDLQQL
jgi:hypothetical protein